MAYKVQKVSPSALAATEMCPRFRPDGKENDAAVDGTLMHEFAEQLVQVPRDQWDGWIATRDASPDMKGMLEEIAATLRTIITEDMPVFTNYRMRLRAGKPRKTPLKPGLYPECELERGSGRHGYIDLLVCTSEGLVYVLDYKSSRIEHDFSLQIAAYACDVNRLCPAHENFICQIIAPRLEDDAQQRLEIGPEELKSWNERIAHIEEVADRSANDDSIRGVPCEACQYCHWCGSCKFQASATQAVAEVVNEDQVTVSAKTGKTTIVQALANLVGPNGPYAGEVVTAQTFLNPPTPAQRGLRRACMKFLETFIESAKEDDRTWAGQFPPEHGQGPLDGGHEPHGRHPRGRHVPLPHEHRGGVRGVFGRHEDARREAGRRRLDEEEGRRGDQEVPRALHERRRAERALDAEGREAEGHRRGVLTWRSPRSGTATW